MISLNISIVENSITSVAAMLSRPQGKLIKLLSIHLRSRRVRMSLGCSLGHGVHVQAEHSQSITLEHQMFAGRDFYIVQRSKLFFIGSKILILAAILRGVAVRVKKCQYKIFDIGHPRK